MYAETALGTTQQDHSSLTVTVDGNDGAHVQRITVTGEMDAVTVDDVREAVADVLRAQHPGRIEMNLRAVSFIDSVGIRNLLLCHSDAARVGCHLELIDPHPLVYRVLQITGLLDHFGLTDGHAPRTR
jgi:anti-sigma B factor antagonist